MNKAISLRAWVSAIVLSALLWWPILSYAQTIAGPSIAPVANRPVGCFFGDSQIADGVGPGSGQVNYYTFSVAAWIRYQTGQRLYTNQGQFFATSGLTTDTWITNWQAQAVAAGCSVAIGRLGTNDISSGTAVATIQNNILSIIRAFNAGNTRVFWYTINPRDGSNVLSTANERHRLQLNAWLRTLNYRTDLNVTVVDPIPLIVDASTGIGKTGMLRDGLHETPLGAMTDALPVSTILNQVYPPIGQPFIDVDDTYNATDNTTGSVFTNGLMAGSVALSGNAVSGNGPTGWTIQNRNSANSGNAASLTAAGSLVADSAITGLQNFQIALGGTAGSGEFVRISQNFTTAAFAVGDTIQAGVTIEWDAGLTNVNTLRICVTHFGGSFNSACDGSGLTGFVFPGATAGSVTLMTPPMTLAAGYVAGTTAINPYVDIYAMNNTSAVSGNVRIKLAWLRKVGATNAGNGP